MSINWQIHGRVIEESGECIIVRCTSRQRSTSTFYLLKQKYCEVIYNDTSWYSQGAAPFYYITHCVIIQVFSSLITLNLLVIYAKTKRRKGELFHILQKWHCFYC